MRRDSGNRALPPRIQMRQRTVRDRYSRRTYLHTATAVHAATCLPSVLRVIFNSRPYVDPGWVKLWTTESPFRDHVDPEASSSPYLCLQRGGGWGRGGGGCQSDCDLARWPINR